MKLSEILKDWPEKQEKEYQEECIELYQQDGYNTALDSCDREIDKEALADELMKMSLLDDYDHKVNHLIKTMPTWLKRSEK